jgi:signal transduction histidine kinase
MFKADNEKLPELSHTVLIEQVKWLIKLRWFAVAGIVVSSLVCTYIFPVLPEVNTIHKCALFLLLFNIAYLQVSFKCGSEPTWYDVAFALFQIEVDLVILTILIHFSGGVTNPFTFFFLFHIILATIILPKRLSFLVSFSTIALFGIMALGEWNEFGWLRHYPIKLAPVNNLWRDPTYMFGMFVAFSATVILTQYLTRTVVARMASKEIEASRNKDLLEAVITAMGEGLIFINNDGEIAISNPEAGKWATGNQALLKDFPGELVAHVGKLMAEKQGQDYSNGVLKFERDGQYVEAKSCPVMDADGSRLGFVIVGQDLTDHKKLESDLMNRTEETEHINEMLKMSRVEMAQREKMVAIGQMATGIAHEIGNPLASLSSIVQYITRKIKVSEQSEQLELMQKQIERISVILRKMLSLSRPATSEYKWVDINTLIESTLSLVRFDKRATAVQFDDVVNTELPMVWLNPLHFEQVLLNIVINALDAMAAKSDQGRNKLKITREFINDMVEVRLSDTGVGMKQDVCRRAFESFFTTKEIGKGTGLGLFISYNIITEVDGSIELESELGKGTTVIIRVPVRPKRNLISDDNNIESAADNIS